MAPGTSPEMIANTWTYITSNDMQARPEEVMRVLGELRHHELLQSIMLCGETMYHGHAGLIKALSRSKHQYHQVNRQCGRQEWGQPVAYGLKSCFLILGLVLRSRFRANAVAHPPRQ